MLNACLRINNYKRVCLLQAKLQRFIIIALIYVIKIKCSNILYIPLLALMFNDYSRIVDTTNCIENKSSSSYSRRRKYFL